MYFHGKNKYRGLLILLSISFWFACTPALVVKRVLPPEISLPRTAKIIIKDSTDPDIIEQSESLTLGNNLFGRLSLEGYAHLEKVWKYKHLTSLFLGWSTPELLARIKKISGAGYIIEYRIKKFTHIDEGGWGEGSMDNINRGAYLNSTVFYLKRRYIMEVAFRAGPLPDPLDPFILNTEYRYSSNGHDRQSAVSRLDVSSTLFPDMLHVIMNKFIDKLSPTTEQVSRELKKTGNRSIDEGIKLAGEARLDEAARLWKQVLENKPSRKDKLAALHNLAAYYEAVGNYKAAARNYRQLFELTDDVAYRKLFLANQSSSARTIYKLD